MQLPEPLGVHATYLVRDGFVLELMDYSKRQVNAGPERVMDQIGLTHITFSVSDLGGALAKVEEFGGAVVDATMTDAMAIIRDPDGQLLELLWDGRFSVLPPRRKAEHAGYKLLWLVCGACCTVGMRYGSGRVTGSVDLWPKTCESYASDSFSETDVITPADAYASIDGSGNVSNANITAGKTES